MNGEDRPGAALTQRSTHTVERPTDGGPRPLRAATRTGHRRPLAAPAVPRLREQERTFVETAVGDRADRRATRFAAVVARRLDRGGPTVTPRPLIDLVDEAIEEAEDLAAWLTLAVPLHLTDTDELLTLQLAAVVEIAASAWEQLGELRTALVERAS